MFDGRAYVAMCASQQPTVMARLVQPAVRRLRLGPDGTGLRPRRIVRAKPAPVRTDAEHLVGRELGRVDRLAVGPANHEADPERVARWLVVPVVAPDRGPLVAD